MVLDRLADRLAGVVFEVIRKEFEQVKTLLRSAGYQLMPLTRSSK